MKKIKLKVNPKINLLLKKIKKIKIKNIKINIEIKIKKIKIKKIKIPLLVGKIVIISLL